MTVHRRDYLPCPFIAKEARIFFNIISASETITRFELSVARRVTGSQEFLRLDGDGLAERTRGVWVNGSPIDWRSMLAENETCLLLPEIADEAQIICEVEHHPFLNTSLTGLYASEQSLLTQCEAQGFRKIAWHIDRPDCMPIWSCEIEAEAAVFPTLLSNGTLVDLQNHKGRVSVCFRDPFPKPSYLFAMVATNLGHIERDIELADGSASTLRLWAKPEELGRLSHAMSSLANAIEWDEERFGLSLDTPEYNVVAAPDFNMGAMENKGLNIFNSKFLLADPDIATDQDYANVEAVVGHEYFHNWTGNRVTVRDWFELTLKEGLTVFRDQEFSSDMNEADYSRAQKATALIATQFPEDESGLSHAPRPESYERVDNLYTSTVYNKGAEIIRMAQTLLGREAFRAGFRLYIERCDGRAAVCEDFLKALRDASGDPLSFFERWWSQAGSPVVSGSVEMLGAGSAIARFSQCLPRRAGEPETLPLLIPIQTGFIANGRLIRARALGSNDAFSQSLLLRLCEIQQAFAIEFDPTDAPVHGEILLSPFHGFSAPVIFEPSLRPDQLAQIALIETDPWAKRAAIVHLMSLCLAARLKPEPSQASSILERSLFDALKHALASSMSPSMKALILSLPMDEALGRVCSQIDPLAFESARRDLAGAIATDLQEPLERAALWERSTALAYSHKADQAGHRALKWRAIGLMAYAAPLREKADQLAQASYAAADNLTDRIGSLAALIAAKSSSLEGAMNDFFARFNHEPLAMDKWLALSALSHPGPQTLSALESTLNAAWFDARNPNRLYSLFRGLLSNPFAFHQTDGSGYAFLARWAARVDRYNSPVAAKLFRSLAPSERLANPWRSAMRAALQEALDGDLSEAAAEVARMGLRPSIEETPPSS